MTDIPSQIDPSEKVGRRVGGSEERTAQGERRLRKSLTYDLTRHRRPEISVDRVSLAGEHGVVRRLVELADASLNDGKFRFQGWADLRGCSRASHRVRRRLVAHPRHR